MSTRREDDSRPGRAETSQRNTARDVPQAKFKEGSVGTVAPRGLRGPSLLPGQGAPEKIVPEEIELAVLRDAETLDGQNVARAVAKRVLDSRSPDARSPSPSPVSVEVPRVRSIPPTLEDRPSTPPSPSARSIQSGTLMSMGSVDPRAPTELSLPTPRPLSVSERAAYLGPEAVVDRTPVHSPRELPGVVDSSRYGEVTERAGSPDSTALPRSSSRSVPVGSGALESARPSLKADSVAPHAQNFARVPHSYSPVSPGSQYATPSPSRGSRPEMQRSQRSGPQSEPDVAPRFQIHSELDAVPHEFRDDAFDLRSASTQREPLASRKALESADWSGRGPVSEGGYRDSEPSARSSRHSSSGFAGLADRGRDTAPPITDRIAPHRASVPLSWVLGAAAFAILLALIVAYVMRPPSASDATRPVDGRASAAAAPSAALLAAPRETTRPSAPQNAEPRASSALPSAVPARPTNLPAKGAPARSGAASGASETSTGAPVGDSSAKAHQSIY